MSYDELNDGRLDLFGVGTGDPGDGVGFAQAFHVGHVIRCALAVWQGSPSVMVAGVLALWGVDLVSVFVVWALSAVMRLTMLQLSNVDLWMNFALVAVWLIVTLFVRFFREMIEAGAITAIAQVCWDGSWTNGALFFAVGPTVRRILVQVAGSAVLAIPGSLLAAITVGIGWATLSPMIESGDYFDRAAWTNVGAAALVVGVVGGLIMAALWSVVWVVLQPAIVAATVGMSPFSAVAYSVRQMRTGWSVIIGLNALYAALVIPLLVLSGPFCNGCLGIVAISLFGLPLSLLHTVWFAGTTLAWMQHARSGESWPAEGVGRTMVDSSAIG